MIDELYDNTVTTEAEYSIDISSNKLKRKICSSLLMLTVQKSINPKENNVAKNLSIKVFTVDNIKNSIDGICI